MKIYKRYQVRSTYIQFDPDHKNTFFNKLSCLNSCLKPNADALRPTQYEANDEPIQERQRGPIQQRLFSSPRVRFTAITVALIFTVVVITLPVALLKQKREVNVTFPVRGDVVLFPSYGEYIISIWTGNNWFGGTDANVFIQLFGQFGNSGELQLEGSSTNPFERGDKDVFKFSLINLGKLKRIHIWHDGSGYNPGWYLEAVEINDKGNNKEYYVNCNTWLEGENPSITIDL